MHSLIWSVVRYGNESLTIKKEDEKRIHVLDIWDRHKIIRIDWTDEEEDGQLYFIKRKTSCVRPLEKEDDSRAWYLAA